MPMNNLSATLLLIACAYAVVTIAIVSDDDAADTIVPEQGSPPGLTHTNRAGVEEKADDSRLISMAAQEVKEENLVRCQAFEWFRGGAANLVAMQARPVDGFHVHHMTLFGCPELRAGVRLGEVEDCRHQSLCAQKPSFMWGYEHMTPDAPVNTIKYAFPKGAAYPVGPGTPHRIAILQVHNNKPIVKAKSEAGFRVFLSPPGSHFKYSPIQEEWDVAADIRSIPPHAPKYKLPSTKIVHSPYHLWGTHLHYHSFGTRIQVHLERGCNGDGICSDGATELIAERVGDRHATSIIAKPIELAQGDKLTAFCEYDTTKVSKPVQIGMNAFTDEMCNVFLLGFKRRDDGGQPFIS